MKGSGLCLRPHGHHQHWAHAETKDLWGNSQGVNAASFCAGRRCRTTALPFAVPSADSGLWSGRHLVIACSQR